MALITRYGVDNFLVLFGIGVAIIAGAITLRHHVPWSILLGTIGIVIIILACMFFRDPERYPPPQVKDQRCVLAPADGRIVQIIHTVEYEYLKSEAIQISIFLSPLDVHVNRYPVTGTVEYVKYYPGKYLVAWDPTSSEHNERCHIGLRVGTLKVLLRQITGMLARRIVYESKVGDTSNAGMRFGMMKFGSRMDIVVPLGTEIRVKGGDRVRAGETVIAWLP